MKVFGLTGWSGSGKTTLMVRLIPSLVARGITVSTMKHAHKGFDIDHPGKDSHSHRMAGATEVLVGSPRRWALMHELRDEEEPGVEALIARMTPVDLLLIEGFKRHDHRKLEVWRAAVGKPLIAPEEPSIVAVASDGPVPGTALPVLPLDDVEAVADFVMRECGLTGRG
ncbi:molybdopterin-guanine dinucleotide biosynthesis protein B [Azospirillum sp. RWY-5-1]|uniref:Molybdopterin-guanine dinucleotide biosynthesis protein B n=1 Tax=Azospirillum oleiclasticum TaxID=2735135 RepID=A0ABX2TKB0_9PROT|nr:molybdopterin-guanine dinucleotide biosynthesis protein B [Azospirillum oleiclasticum]NYZ17405.1 molybdopterin-guanine dinucleotide biosynthesis protein B [Azospirillum oleiclasticum]NYZ24782.1 molybdopterin-guanine dinucleotide biosynthesis protein B [Azospirillum oleiclasticum]